MTDATKMTTIPSTPEFQALLDSLTVSTALGELELLPGSDGQAADGNFHRSPALHLHCKYDGKLRPTVLLRKIHEALSKSPHPGNEAIARRILGIFTVLRPGHPDAVELFNAILNGTTTADVTHFAIYPWIAQEGIPAEFMGYKCGELRGLSLEYRSTKANSDYYQLHGRRRARHHSMESPVFQRSVIRFGDLYWYAPEHRRIHHELFSSLLLGYYEALSTIYTDAAWEELDRRQAICAASGLELFAVPDISRCPGLGVVTVYLNQSDHPRARGYVVPTTVGMNANSWSGTPPILEKAKTLIEDLEYPYSPTLTQVARYVVRARRATEAEKWPDALLNYTIALEMLFSERSQTSQALARRVAVAVSKGVSAEYEPARKETLALYDARSRYVHAGDEPPPEAIAKMEALVANLMEVLLGLERGRRFSDPAGVEEWAKKLDWIAAGFEAGQSPPESVLKEAVLIESGSGN